jgi:type II secretory pathway pseudopilin PulG
MATTQSNKNAVVLKPLNVGRALGQPRQRRSSDQVQASRIARQNMLAEKANKRAAALEERQKRARERAALATQRAQEIQAEAEQKQREQQEAAAREAQERTALQTDSQRTIHMSSSPKTTAVVPKTPHIEQTLKKIDKDFQKFYQHIFDTYGVQFTGTTPNLVKRGFVSMKLRGELEPQKRAIEPTASATGVAREAVRFMQFYKEAGLTPAWLNREVKIKDDPNTYVLTGLRGKAHSIVLRKKDTDEAFTMSAQDFKKSLA